MATLFTCLFLIINPVTSIEVVPFTTDPGIYFENLGSASIVTSEWNIVAYFDMQPYLKEVNNIRTYPPTIKGLCEWAHTSKTCPRIVKQIERSINDLTSNNLLLNPRSKTRTKRGALNFVGNVAHALFGVLDSEYAEQAAATIDKIRENEDHIATEMKKQTSYLDSTINIMKSSQQEIEHEFNKIEELLNRTNRQLSNISHQLDADRAMQTFTELGLHVSLSVSSLRRIQDALLDVLTDTHHGKINPILISPEQLQAQLQTIKVNLPSSLKLPISTDEILKFYNVMSVEGRVTDSYIIFKLKLPLVASEAFELFKLTSVPWNHNGNFFMIAPSWPYLILNLHQDQYQPLAEEELRRCISVEEDNHLCRQTHPLYKRGSPILACELNLLNHDLSNSSCRVVPAGIGPHWIQLHNPNHWIYSLEHEMNINAVCDNNLERFHLGGSGLLKLRENCMIKQPLITIQGHRSLQSTSRISFIPSINASEIYAPVAISALPAGQYVNQYAPHLDELQTIRENLAKVKDELPNNLRPHDVHHYALGYICLGSIVLLGAILIWKLRRSVYNLASFLPDSDMRSITNLDAGRNRDHHSSEVEFVTVFPQVVE